MADEAESPDMTTLGIKRKDMHPPGMETGPKSEKDYDNEIIFPRVSVSGKQAEMMGAGDLQAGECVKQTVIWRVKSREKREDGEKVEYSMELELVKGSDLEPCDDKDKPDDDKEDSDGDDDDGGDEPASKPSAGLAFILGGKGANPSG